MYVQTINDKFIEQVQKAFPDKNAKIMVACSDGRIRAIAALEAMDDLGYVNIVGLRGGANLWTREWDAKMVWKRAGIIGHVVVFIWYN